MACPHGTACNRERLHGPVSLGFLPALTPGLGVASTYLCGGELFNHDVGSSDLLQQGRAAG